MQDLISCVMAINKDDVFVNEAIESILNQTYQNFEFLIIANACTEELWQKVLSFEKRDPRIRAFRTKIGQLPYNLNVGLDQARGKYFARMDADDISSPHRFEKQIQFLQKNPEVSVLGTWVEIINDKNILVETYQPPCTNLEIRKKLPWNCPLIHPTIMAKVEVLIKLRGYSFGFYAEDYDLWLRAAQNPEIVFHNLDEICLKYRVHSAQSSHSKNLMKHFPLVASLAFRLFLETKNPVYLFSMMKRWIYSYRRS